MKSAHKQGREFKQKMRERSQQDDDFPLKKRGSTAKDRNRYGAPDPGVPSGPRPSLSKLDDDVTERDDDA